MEKSLLGTVGGEAAEQALRSVPWLQPLSFNSRAWLAQHSRVRDLHKGQLLLDQGDAVPALVLLEGELLAERCTGSDRLVVLRQAQAMDCVAVDELLDGLPAAARWRATRPSRVLQVGRDMFLAALRTDPLLATRLAAHVSQQVRRANQRVLMLSCSTVEERVLQVMRELARQDLRGRWVVHKPVSQRELAHCVAASREMTSRSLASLKARGLLCYQRWAEVEVQMPPSAAVPIAA